MNGLDKEFATQPSKVGELTRLLMQLNFQIWISSCCEI